MNIASVKEDRDDLLVYKSTDLNELKRIRILGLPIDNLSRDEVMAYLLAALENKNAPQHVLFVDPIKLFTLRFKRKLKPIVKQANLVLADGSGLLWASRWQGTPLKERIPIIAVVIDLMRLAMRSDFTVYLMGSHPERVKEVFFNFQRSFPNVRVIGRHSSVLSGKQGALVKESLRKSAPDIIFLGMEFPSQEFWIKENKKYIGNAVILGIDDSFEFLSGTLKKSPDWVQTRGLNWLWYTIKHPWRIHHFFAIFCFYAYSLIKSLPIFKKNKRKNLIAKKK